MPTTVPTYSAMEQPSGGCTTSKLPGGKCGKKGNRYAIKCVPDFTGFTSEAVPGDWFKSTQSSCTSTTDMACTTTQLTTYSSTPASQNTGITSMSESSTVSRTTMPANTTPSSRQPTSEVHQNSSHSGPPICCMHVHQHKVRLANRENHQP